MDSSFSPLPGQSLSRPRHALSARRESALSGGPARGDAVTAQNRRRLVFALTEELLHSGFQFVEMKLFLSVMNRTLNWGVRWLSVGGVKVLAERLCTQPQQVRAALERLTDPVNGTVFWQQGQGRRMKLRINPKRADWGAAFKPELEAQRIRELDAKTIADRDDNQLEFADMNFEGLEHVLPETILEEMLVRIEGGDGHPLSSENPPLIDRQTDRSFVDRSEWSTERLEQEVRVRLCVGERKSHWKDWLGFIDADSEAVRYAIRKFDKELETKRTKGEIIGLPGAYMLKCFKEVQRERRTPQKAAPKTATTAQIPKEPVAAVEFVPWERLVGLADAMRAAIDSSEVPE